MTMSIMNASEREGVVDYYDPKFHRFLETYLLYLRAVSEDSISVDPHMSYVYQGDVYGLFKELGILADRRWIVMRLNDIKSPTEIPDDLDRLILPNENTLLILIQKFRLSIKK